MDCNRAISVAGKRGYRSFLDEPVAIEEFSSSLKICYNGGDELFMKWRMTDEG